jgi:hypothetical protein
MLLGEWRKTAPNRECLSSKVLAVLKPVLTDLGADGDPECWVLWGEDPEFKYSIMAPTQAGLITVAVRVGGMGGDGPRATAKLVRWSKLTVGELSIEAASGHRIVAVQVEGQVLKGTDEEADQICEFCRGLLAGIDGRAFQPVGPVYVAAAPPVVAVPKAAAAPVGPGPKAPARQGLKALPAPAEELEEEDESESAEPAPATPEAARKPARTPAPKPQPAWVAPHPIGAPLPALQPVVPVAARPAVPKPQPALPTPPAHPAAPAAPAVPAAPAAPAVPTAPAAPAAPAVPVAPAAHAAPARPAEPQPAEGGAVWDVPASPDPQTRESKRPRTWAP